MNILKNLISIDFGSNRIINKVEGINCVVQTSTSELGFRLEWE